MMRSLLLPFSLMLALYAQAQVRSDRPIILEGGSSAERQVQGLDDANASDEAINARSVQAGAYQYAEVAGDTWQATLQPAATPVAGMRLLLHANNTNSGPVTLSVNGSNAYPVLTAGSTPLVAGEVQSGATVSVVFDGSAFQLISARRMQRKPCPPNTVQVNELYCIETQQHDTLEFPAAADACGSLGMKLCSWAQFYTACVNSASLGLTDMVGDWEWADDAANSDISVRVMGQASCSHISVTVGWGVIARNFHCCFKR